VRAACGAIVLASAAIAGGCSDRTVGIDSGKLLEIDILREGLGRAARDGDEVNVRYRAWLPDGTPIDEIDLFKQGKTHRFRIGDGTVLGGVNDAVIGMKPGGMIRVVVPPLLHYGHGGHAGIIPPDTDMIFEIEMLAVYG
jgi:FKBP-type peptidyl-prolyl cis-trans isomerase